MLKLSNFLQTRKVVFNEDGTASIINPKLEGEIIPRNLGSEQSRIKLTENILTDEKALKDDDYFMYKAFEYILEVENDITLEQFTDLKNNPRNNFELLIEIALASLNDFFNTMKNVERIGEKAETIKENNKEIFELIELEKEIKEEKKVVQKPKAKKKRVSKKDKVSVELVEIKEPVTNIVEAIE